MPIDKNKWSELVECGIIEPHTTLLTIMKKKKNMVNSKHPYAITALTDGRFGTYVYDEKKTNHRKQIKTQTEDGMYEKLYEFYFKDDSKNGLRLCDIFREWLDYKCKKKNNKAQTKKQNCASYNKYVAGTTLDTMRLTNIKSIDLEEWAIDILVKHHMTAKCFNTHKIVVTGMLSYAKRKGYISTNPWIREELEYTHLFKSERIKSSAKMIFYPDEIENLLEVLEYGYEQNGNIANLGIELNFDLGLRVGELAALKWSDIDWRNETVFIQRQEDSSETVEDYVKSDSSAGYRELEMSDNVIAILKRIRQRNVLSEFVFTNEDGSRAGKMQFEHRLTRAEKAMGWVEGNFKYSHCIRRTVASRMNVVGFSLEEVRRWLGHTSKETTLKYIYNPFRQSATKVKIKQCSILTNNKIIDESEDVMEALKTILKTAIC